MHWTTEREREGGGRGRASAYVEGEGIPTRLHCAAWIGIHLRLGNGDAGRSLLAKVKQGPFCITEDQTAMAHFRCKIHMHRINREQY